MVFRTSFSSMCQSQSVWSLKLVFKILKALRRKNCQKSIGGFQQQITLSKSWGELAHQIGFKSLLLCLELNTCTSQIRAERDCSSLWKLTTKRAITYPSTQNAQEKQIVKYVSFSQIGEFQRRPFAHTVHVAVTWSCQSVMTATQIFEMNKVLESNVRVMDIV